MALLTLETGGLPWVSLTLAVSWGFYALFKKTLPIGPAQGFFLEVLILSIPALGYIVWLQARGVGHFGGTGAADVWLLLGCGIVTAVPLILFANGAKLLRLSTIGIMQYIAPTHDLLRRGLHLQGAVQHDRRRRLRADLGGAGDLFLVDVLRKPRPPRGLTSPAEYRAAVTASHPELG